MSQQKPNGNMRCADADRERVAGVLREAAAAGRITLEELDERLDAAFAARTYGDLEPLTADLPADEERTEPLAPSGGAEPAEAARPLVLKSSAGTIVRRGEWTAPRRIEVTNPMGSTVLDFRSATLLSGTTEIALTSSWGEARLVLPDGATADVRVDASWWGSVDSRVPPAPARPNPHFVVTGEVKGGNLKIRYKNRFEEMFGMHG